MRIINKLIYFLGSIVLIISWIQWFFRFPDTSQLFLGSGIGISLLAFGYIYSWMLNKNEEISKLENKIDGLIKLYTKGELE
jgi:low affinity Fe/Cu permease